MYLCLEKPNVRGTLITYFTPHDTLAPTGPSNVLIGIVSVLPRIISLRSPIVLSNLCFFISCLKLLLIIYICLLRF